MYWSLLIAALLFAGPAHAAKADMTVKCPKELTFDNKGQLKSAKPGRCVDPALQLQQNGGFIRLQNGGRILCVGSC